MTRLLEWLPRGNTLDDAAWHRRHRLLQVVLAIHVPLLLALGLGLGSPVPLLIGAGIAPIVVALVAGHFVTHKRTAASLITAGLVWCSITLVAVTGGTIEAHFHFFIIIGFIALYQDWIPFLLNVLMTGISHIIGTIFWPTLIFNHPAAQQNPALWATIHAVAVLFACLGLVIFWRITEDEQSEKHELGRELVRADAEIGRKQFTSDMLVNLARRNQSMLYRQLDIINQLEEKEQDPDQLAELFKLDHLATRVRRNAESLLVLSGEQPPRVWSAPVSMRDVVRAAIAETEDLDRVEFSVDDRVAVAGHSVADLTHLLAELTENAVRFSPPDTSVTIRSRPHRAEIGGQVLTVEDWGVGMPADELASANELLIRPREVDLSVSQRLGFHVVARLATRHRIEVSLSTTPGSGLTAVVILPAELFVSDPQAGPHAGIGSGPEQTRRVAAVHEMTPAEHSAHHGMDLAGDGGESTAVLPGFAGAGLSSNGASGPALGARRTGSSAVSGTGPTLASAAASAPSTPAGPSAPPSSSVAPAWTPPPAPPARRPTPTPRTGVPSTAEGLAPQNGAAPHGAAPYGGFPGQIPANWTGWWDPAPADRVPLPDGARGEDTGRIAADWAGSPADTGRGRGVNGTGGTAISGNGLNGASAHGAGNDGVGRRGLGGDGSRSNGHGTASRLPATPSGSDGAASRDPRADGTGTSDTGSHSATSPSAASPSTASHGSGTNGSGTNGLNGLNGSGTNGSSADGSGAIGAGSHGPAANGANGSGANGTGPGASDGLPGTGKASVSPEQDGAGRLPIPTPRPASAGSAGTGNSGLRRRVPQAALAPELRASGTAAPTDTAPARSEGASAGAAAALSRYQASRQAAQAVADQHDDSHHTDDRRTHQ